MATAPIGTYVLAHVAGYGLAVAMPALLLGPISVFYWRILAREAGVPDVEITRHRRVDLPAFVGGIERILIVAAWLGDRPELIGVWLVLKVAGNWSGWADDRKIEYNDGNGLITRRVTGRHLFNVFLVGTGLSLLNGLAYAVAITRYLVGDHLVAWGAPVAAFFATFVVWVWAYSQSRPKPARAV